MTVWEQPRVIAPSLICLDMCNLESQIRLMEENGIGAVHIDILDGHFSPSMPLGLETVRQLREKTKLIFDAHLMVSQPDYFIGELLDIGVQQLIVHVETAAHLDGILNRIKAKGVRAGVALKPGTSLDCLEYVLEKCDAVLLMLINPGYASSAGEAQVSYAERKITRLREMIDSRGLKTSIELDGRISRGNIKRWGNGLADIFVAGSTLIDKDKPEAGFGEIAQLEKEVII